MDAPPPAKGRSKDIEREQPRLDTVQLRCSLGGDSDTYVAQSTHPN